MALNTRERLLDVARQLFAKKGVENTTMNDIAEVSGKGRRTIYTYFRNKREIFNALVHEESEKMIQQLTDLLTLDADPEEKLKRFIFIRFEAVKETVSRNGSLRALFFRDVRKVEHARRLTTAREAAILRQILADGVAKGVFRIERLDQTVMVLLLALQGLDVPYIRDNFAELGIDKLSLRDNIMNFILHGIKR